MGRAKIEIKKIDKECKIKSTFGKRRNGLIKKAYEISVLCDIDVALILFSPANKLFHFSGKNRRLEDVLIRFLDLPNVESKMAIRNKADLITLLERLKYDEDLAAQALGVNEEFKPKISEETDDEDEDVEKNPLDSLKSFIREEINKPITSPHDFHFREKKFVDILNQVQFRKNYLISNIYSRPTISQLFEMSQLQQHQQSVKMPNDAALLNMQQQQEEAFKQDQELADFIQQQQQQPILMPMNAALHNMQQQQQETFKQEQEMVMTESNSAALHMSLHQGINDLRIDDEFAPVMQNNNPDMPIQTSSKTNLPALKEEPWNNNKNDSIGPCCNDDPFNNLEPIIEEKDLCLIEPSTMSSHAYAYPSSFFMENTWNSDMTNGSNHSLQDPFEVAGDISSSFPNFEQYDNSGNMTNK